MTSIYNPNGTLLAPPSGAGAQNRFLILSSTNTSPIAVTFSAPTNIQDQDSIEIEGHAVNTAANGFWVATKMTSSVYTLNGSTGNGVGGNTGWATDYTLNPLLTLPGDTELITASAINTPIEGTANAIPYLYRGLGKYRVYNEYTTTYGTNSGAPPIWSVTTTSSVTYVACTGTANLFSTLPPPHLQAGDALGLSVGVQFTSSGTDDGFLALGLSIGGAAYVASTEEVWVPSHLTPGYQCHTFCAFVTIGAPADNFDIQFMCRMRAGGANVQPSLMGIGRAVAIHYRSN